MNQLRENNSFESYQTLSPDQAFVAVYEANNQQHEVAVQWMGEGKNTIPGYYVFEGEKYTKQPEHVVIDPQQLLSMSIEELKAAFPDEEELNPLEATRVIDFEDGIGWIERGIGKTDHSEAIGRVIERVFS